MSLALAACALPAVAAAGGDGAVRPARDGAAGDRRHALRRAGEPRPRPRPQWHVRRRRRRRAVAADGVEEALLVRQLVGEEDGVDNTEVDNAKLYTQPEEVALAYQTLLGISPRFTIAASFGNVHGVYKPGNVQLTPVILKNSQSYIQEKFDTEYNPVDFVFHGGSGSSIEEIREAISYGVVKMNIDTDLQFAFTEGIRDYIEAKMPYLRTQIGNPEGEDQPNKKYYKDSSKKADQSTFRAICPSCPQFLSRNIYIE